MSKISKVEEWLEDSKEQQCTEFLAVSINSEFECCSFVGCNVKSLTTMLLALCECSDLFRDVLINVSDHYCQEGGAR